MNTATSVTDAGSGLASPLQDTDSVRGLGLVKLRRHRRPSAPERTALLCSEFATPDRAADESGPQIDAAIGNAALPALLGAVPVDTYGDAFVAKLVGAIQNPVFVKDDHFRYVFVNDAFCTLMKMERTDLIGRTDFEFIVPAQANGFRERDARILADAINQETEEGLTNLVGEHFWISTRKSIFDFPIHGAGCSRYIVGVISDITRSKKAARDLKTAKLEADDANRAKTSFLANMSHELRTPMNAIIGFSDIMKSGLYGELSPRYKGYAEDINESGSHLLALINDVLDLSKIDSGKYELHEEDCDLDVVIESGIRFVRLEADRTGILLIHPLASELPPLRADARAVKQIITNLLANAVKFTPSGGRVEISAVLEEDNGLSIRVADTGIGMKASDIPRALSAFQQLEGSWDKKYQGTGLGLPLTKSLLALHEGILQIESEPGEGTTVTARFPAQRTTGEAIPA